MLRKLLRYGIVLQLYKFYIEGGKNIKKMLISIILMVIFVLTTTSTFSFAEQNMTWQKEKIVEQNPANCWGSASLYISGITSNALADCKIKMINPIGNYKCSYGVTYEGLKNYKFKGDWHVEARIGKIIFFDKTVEFDFENFSTPNNESDQRTRTISSGIKYANIACWVKGEMYEWDGDKWVFESYFSSSASDSNTGSFPVKHMKPFCTLLKQHPYLTSIIKNL